MDLDVVTLSRAQFALTVMFHYLFPPLSIGLGAMLVMNEGTYLRTGDKEYESAARFWTKLFAVNFAVGVASGIVMEFQFGTNWATYSRFVGDVFGSALAAEGIFAFFLESGFLAVLVFGWDRVSPRVHFFATLMVFLGSCFSAVWIVIANSWQQTPAGFHIVGEGAAARAEITDFWAMVFNPSSMHRLNHVLLGALLTGAFFVMSIAAWYMLKRRHETFARKQMSLALGLGLVVSLVMLVSGHQQADAVADNQPPKLAAFEGHFHTGEGGAPLWLVGWPDVENEKVNGVGIPGMLSFLLHGDFDAPVQGLDRTPPEDRPPVVVPFVTYHLMVALGFYFVALTIGATWLHRAGRLVQMRWLLWVIVISVMGPYVANQAGWVAAEVGRQPWVVYGLLRTVDAASPTVTAGEVVTSIALFSVAYVALFALWLFVMNEKIRHGPEPVGEQPRQTRPDDLLEAAGGFVDHAGKGLSRGAEGEGPAGVPAAGKAGG